MQKIKVSSFENLIVILQLATGKLLVVHGSVNQSVPWTMQTREPADFIIVDFANRPVDETGRRFNPFNDIVHRDTGETLGHYKRVATQWEMAQACEPESPKIVVSMSEASALITGVMGSVFSTPEPSAVL